MEQHQGGNKEQGGQKGETPQVPEGYAVEFGTGRLIPIPPQGGTFRQSYVARPPKRRRGCCGG